MVEQETAWGSIKVLMFLFGCGIVMIPIVYYAEKAIKSLYKRFGLV